MARARKPTPPARTGRLGSGRSDQSKASVHRKIDADVLRTANRFRGAMYLLGYAVECSLKVRLLETHDCYTLDQLQRRLGHDGSKFDVYTHSLGRLMELVAPMRRLPAPLRGAWSVVQKWDVAWRYRGEGSKDAVEAEKFFSSVRRVLGFLSANR